MTLFSFVLALLTGAAAACYVASSQPGEMLLPAFALAACAALVLTPLAMLASHRLGVLDVPDERKTHEGPMPLLGGPAVLAAFLVAAGVSAAALPPGFLTPELRRQLIAITAGSGLIALMGVIDDRWGLNPGIRLLGQLAAVAVVMRYGVVATFLPATPAGQVGEVVLTILWLVGITNAVNFLDGLDGLASGVAAVAALSFGLIAAMTGQVVVAIVSFCLAGAVAGFLRHNFRPAGIYLGDSGATFLGFLLACIGLLGDWGTRDRAEDLLVPVLVLGIPIYDTLYITIYRIRAGHVRNFGEWTAYVGRDHLHHRLQHLGMRPERACLFIWLGSVALGILAVILKTKGDLDRYDKFLAITIAVIMFLGTTVLMELGKNRRGGSGGEGATPPRGSG